MNISNKTKKELRVALVHDHLAQQGGAEKVLKVLSDMYPNAPIYTLLYEKKHTDKYLKGKTIKTSIIQRLPGGVKYYKWYLPFMPMAVEFYDLSDFDLVISDASAFAKGVITSPDTLHICYCHTPTRYLWDYTHKYINELNYNKYFKKVISLILNRIRVWDKVAADRVDVYIANSKTVKRRISKYYRRDSTVIYPPVELDKCKISDNIDDFFLIGGRLAPYKRVDIVIEAFTRMNKKLKIFGDGIELERLKMIAGKNKNIEFLGRVSDDKRADLYSKCIAFINPQEEDFGITVIEAMASGRPVIAYNFGGASETIIDGKTGILFNEQSADAIIEAVQNFGNYNFDSCEIAKHASNFSVDKFKNKIKDFVSTEWEKFANKS